MGAGCTAPLAQQVERWRWAGGPCRPWQLGRRTQEPLMAERALRLGREHTVQVGQLLQRPYGHWGSRVAHKQLQDVLAQS